MERASFANLTFNPDHTIMQFNNAFADRQTQPKAVYLAR